MLAPRPRRQHWERVTARRVSRPVQAVEQWLGKSGRWRFFDQADPARILRSAGSGLPLAGVLLIIVLVLVCLETVMARWFSHARGGRGADGLTGGLPTSMSEVSARQMGAMR